MKKAFVLLLACVAAPGFAAGDTRRFEICATLAQTNPGRAIAVAQAWRVEGGGILARNCLALAQFESGNYNAALESFAAAARDATRAPDTRAEAERIWLNAANAGLMAGRPAAVAVMVDEALSLPPAADIAARLMLLKAEALVDLKQEAAALPVIEAALVQDADVPNGWLLKATLARRLGKLPLAEAAILEAGRRTPGDPAVSYEAGNIAKMAGRTELARAAWTAAAVDSETEAGKAAARALAADAEAKP